MGQKRDASVVFLDTSKFLSGLYHFEFLLAMYWRACFPHGISQQSVLSNIWVLFICLDSEWHFQVVLICIPPVSETDPKCGPGFAVDIPTLSSPNSFFLPVSSPLPYY